MSAKSVKKAIFPVGGLGTRFLPATKAMPKEMLPIVDKPLIQYAVEEALSAGIEEIIFVTGRGKSAIEDHFDVSYELEKTLEELGKDTLLQEAESTRLKAGHVFYTRQQKARGLGHAIWCARHFIHDEPFAVILADDFILGTPCLQEMVEMQAQWGGNMVAVQNVPRTHVHRYGIIQGKEEESSPLIAIEKMIEKPSAEETPSTLAIVGRYILYPEIFDALERDLLKKEGEIQLTDAMASALKKRPFYGYRFSGRRFDCGNKVGMVNATLNVALSREDLREELLQELQHLQFPEGKGRT